MMKCRLDCRSILNSILPPLMSLTALPTSLVTVPVFGFGIRPRGPSTRPSRPTLPIRSGVATTASKSRKPPFTRSISSSVPTMSYGALPLQLVSRLPDRQSRSIGNCAPHRSRGTGDNLRGSVEVVGVQVRHLGLGDLTHLGTRDRRDLDLVWLTAALLDRSRLEDQLRRRRRLRDEVEGAVFVNADLDRDDVAALRLGRRVVRLAELHDVDAVLSQRRTHRWRRRRGGGVDLQLDDRGEFLLGRHASSFGSCSGLYLRDLAERELHRRLAAEDRHQNLELLRVRVDLVDRRRQRRERSVHDRHRLADLVVDDLGRLDLLLLRLRGEDARHLVEGERRRSAALPDEA